MTEIQKSLYGLMVEIDQICKENDIDYYLAGGTLIGAIRHEGFLPWDDDADLLMTRENWKKFIKAFRSGRFPENRVLVGCDVDRSYPNMFGRYIDTSTTAIHTGQLTDDAPAGMVVDILPLDPIPDDRALQRRYFEDIALYSDLLNENAQYSIRLNCNDKRYPRCRKLIEKGLGNLVFGWLNRRLFSYKEEKCDYYALRWAGAALFSKKEIYGKPKLAKFEDSMFMVPARSADYLTWHFGDAWMYVPPHEERMSHRALYSMDMDYKEMRQHIKKYINRPKLHEANIQRKEIRLVNHEVIHERMDNELELEVYCVQAKIKAKIAEEQIDVTKLMKQKKYVEIKKIFAEYIKTASSRDMIGREDFDGTYRFFKPFFIDIGTRNFEAVVSALTYTGEMTKALRLIDVYYSFGGEKTKTIGRLQKVIHEIRSAISDYGVGEFEKSNQKTDELLKHFPDNQDLLKLKIRLLFELSAKNENQEEIKKLVKKTMELYSEDGELHKYEGDLLIREGKILEGLKKYFISGKTTSNGYIALEIKRYIRSHVKEVIGALEEADFAKEEHLTEFLDYICERGHEAKQAEQLTAACFEIYIKYAQTTKELVDLYEKLSKSSLRHSELFITLGKAICEKAGADEKNIEIYEEYAAAVVSHNLKEYIEAKRAASDLCAAEYKFLGDAFFESHLVHAGFAAYEKALSAEPEEYIRQEIIHLQTEDKKQLKNDYYNGLLTEELLKDIWKRRYGTTIEEV